MQCENSIVYSAPTINGANTYIWTLPFGAIGTSTTNTISVSYSNSALSGKISVRGQNTNGYGVESFLDITVNPVPVQAGAIEGISTICPNNSAVYTVAPITNADSYIWSLPNGVVGTSTTNSISAYFNTGASSGNITVAGHNFCGNGQPAALPINIVQSPIPEICMVSIRDKNNIIIWDKPVSTDIDSFQIWKETNITNVFAKIGAVAYTDSSIFVDTSSNPSIQSNKYKLSSINSCKVQSALSEIAHQTMHLTINQGPNNSWNLIWQPYIGFVVNSYKIYRGLTPNNLSLIGSTSNSSSQYTDFSAPSGTVFYQVQIINPNQCTPDKSEVYNISFSNISSSYTNSINENSDKKIHIYPNPVNEKFVIDFGDNSSAENYSIKITNVLGVVVYTKEINNNRIEINASSIGNKGLYFIQLTDCKSQTVHIEKILIQ